MCNAVNSVIYRLIKQLKVEVSDVEMSQPGVVVFVVGTKRVRAKGLCGWGLRSQSEP